MYKPQVPLNRDWKTTYTKRNTNTIIILIITTEEKLIQYE